MAALQRNAGIHVYTVFIRAYYNAIDKGGIIK